MKKNSVASGPVQTTLLSFFGPRDALNNNSSNSSRVDVVDDDDDGFRHSSTKINNHTTPTKQNSIKVNNQVMRLNGDFTTAAALRHQKNSGDVATNSSSSNSNNSNGALANGLSPETSTPTWHSVTHKKSPSLNHQQSRSHQSPQQQQQQQQRSSTLRQQQHADDEEDDDLVLVSSPYFRNTDLPQPKRSTKRGQTDTPTRTSLFATKPSTPSSLTTTQRRPTSNKSTPLSSTTPSAPSSFTTSKQSESYTPQQLNELFPSLSSDGDDVVDLTDSPDMKPSSRSNVPSSASASASTPSSTIIPTNVSQKGFVTSTLSSSSTSALKLSSFKRTFSQQQMQQQQPQQMQPQQPQQKAPAATSDSARRSSTSTASPFNGLNASVLSNTTTLSAFKRRKTEATLSSSSSSSSDHLKSNRFELAPSIPKPLQNYSFSSSEVNFLSEEQRAVLELAMTGCSFFFTGAAGTGKSFLLKQMIKELSAMHGSSSVFVTASTGIAACNIGGTTLHSFAGVGLAKADPDALVAKVMKSNFNRKKWQSAKVLIIDEISMVGGDFFEKVEYVGRRVRRCEKPFGGLQVLMCGDFFQLPPVEDKFCFETEAFKRLIGKNVIELRKVFRQSDPTFVNILNTIRRGLATPDVVNKLNARMITREQLQKHQAKGAIMPTHLYSHRGSVDSENNRMCQALVGEQVEYVASDEGNENYLAQLQQSCPAPAKLGLKLGAQVILLRNLDFEKELVNGSRGVVEGFTAKDKDGSTWPLVRFVNGVCEKIQPHKFSIEMGGVEMASRTQIPLHLAWALSIHKSQGMTIDRLVIKLDDVFEYGQAYVALSRATSLEGMQLLGFSSRVIKAHPKVINFYEQMTTLVGPQQGRAGTNEPQDHDDDDLIDL